MTRLLSIFSFNTLAIRPRVPRTLLVALLVVAAVEAAVRYHRAQQPGEYGHSLVWMIKDYEQATQAKPAGAWLLGNSTLGKGIDEQAFESLAGIDAVKMPHGSCNVRGYDELLGYYLEHAPAPERVIVFINKDDLSSHGPRAEITAGYLDFVNESALRPSHWLTLSFASTQLREAGVKRFDAAYSSILGQDTAAAQQSDRPSPDAMVFDPKVKPVGENEILSGVVRGWSYDEQSLRSIVERANQHGVREVAVVLMPCTDALAAYHDQHLPEQNYTQVRERTRELLESMGVRCLDLAVATDRHDLFFDSYHLNATGRRVLTQAVGEWVADGMPARAPMTEAGFVTLARRVLGPDASQQIADVRVR